MKNFILIILVTLILPGCALKATSTSTSTFTSEEIQNKTREHFALAQQYENNGDLKKALIHFKIAGNLESGSKVYTGEIERLSGLIKENAAVHYKRALELQSQNRLVEARNEFIKTLWYDNDNAAALLAIKERPEQTSWKTYVVGKGDTLNGIAEKTMGSKKKAFLIAGLNELQVDAILPVGTRLIIPQWDEKRTAKKPKAVAEPEEETEPAKVEEVIEAYFVADDELAVVRQHIENKKFEEALAVISEIRRYDPKNKEVPALEDTTNCELAKILAGKKDFTGAALRVNQISPTAACLEDTKIIVSNGSNEEAQRLYLVGVKYYINENLQQAISTWEKTLELNPEHGKAKDDMENAKSLLDKFNKVK